MLDTTTITLLTSPKNKRIMRPVNPAPIKTLRRHALDRRHHGGRLVELEADLHVLGDGVAERLHRLVDVGHHGQRRSRILLYDRQIDRLLAVDQGIAISNVNIILDGRHVTEIDVFLQPQWDISQAFDIDDRGVVGTTGIESLT